MGSSFVAMVLLGLFALLAYALIRIGASAIAGLLGARYRPYRQLAMRYHGRFESRGFSDPPTVSFTHQGANVRVGLAPQVGGKSQVVRTRVVIRFPRGLPFRLELAPIARPAPPQPPRATRLVRVGNPDFDRRYVVQANDHEMACTFLSPPVRSSIGWLDRLSPPGGFLISINPERMLVQIDRNLGQGVEGLDEAVRESLVIHEGLRRGVSERLSDGIAIVSAGPASAGDSGPPICKVCGELIDGPGVLCDTCRTPHHHDCWEFVGACSIYGCNGKRSIRA